MQLPVHFIQITGVEAQKLLQGQVPADLTKMDDNTSTITSLCLPNGKLISIFRLFKQNEDNFLCLFFNEQNLEDAFAYFSKHKLFFKVVISKIKFSQEQSLYFVINPEYFETVQTFTFNSDSDISYVDHQPVGFSEEQHQILIPDYASGLGMQFVNCDLEQHNKSSNIDFEALDVSGILLHDANEFLAASALQNIYYELPLHLKDEFLPQALFLDSIEAAVSYNKGCYLGQEGISRGKFRGANTQETAAFVVPVNKLSQNDLQPILEAISNNNNPQLEIQLFAQLENSIKETGKALNTYRIINRDLIVGLGYSEDTVALLVTPVVLQKKLTAADYPYSICYSLISNSDDKEVRISTENYPVDVYQMQRDE